MKNILALLFQLPKSSSQPTLSDQKSDGTIFPLGAAKKKLVISKLHLVFLAYFLFQINLAFAETARIATWNIGGFYQIPQHKLSNIIKGLKNLNADIVVLTEINPNSHGDVIAQSLSEDPGICYKAIVPDQPRASQEIAFLHRCEVEVSNTGLILSSDLEKRGYRAAVYTSVKIKEFDFVLIGLHLKASGGSASRKLRDRQLLAVNGFIQGVLSASSEKDILIIGDYNMIPGEDDQSFKLFNAGNNLEFISSGLTGGSHLTTYQNEVSVGNLLDAYGFTNIDAREYMPASIEIVQMHEILNMSLKDYKNKATDHLPLVATFNVDTDND